MTLTKNGDIQDEGAKFNEQVTEKMHKIFDQSERALCLGYDMKTFILHVYYEYIFLRVVMRFTSK